MFLLILYSSHILYCIAAGTNGGFGLGFSQSNFAPVLSIVQVISSGKV